MIRAGLGLALLAGCPAQPGDTAVPGPSRTMVRAARVSSSNAGEMLLVGSRADGEVGSYAITNGSLTAIIDAAAFDEELGVAEQRHRSPAGGSLLDLAPPGARDALSQVIQVVNYDPAVRVYYQRVSVVEEGKAIQAVGRILDPERSLGLALDDDDLVEQIVVTTTWRMWDREPWLEVETTVGNQTSRPVDMGPVVDLVVTDGLAQAPYVPSPGLGFELPDEELLIAPWVAFSGEPGAAGSQGVLSLGDGHLHVLSDADIDGRIRGVFLGREAKNKESISPGEQHSWTRRYTASPDTGLAGVTHNIVDLLSRQPGSFHLELGISEISRVEIGLEEPRAGLVTFFRTDPARFLDSEGRVQEGGAMPVAAIWATADDSALEAWLPVGGYELELSSPGPDARTAVFEVQEGLEEYGPITLPAADTTAVYVDIRTQVGEANSEPLRLTVVGLGGTADPQLDRHDLAAGELAGGNRIWTDAGELLLQLPDGAYRVIASRGPLAPLALAELRVPETDLVELVLDDPVLAVEGWASVDPFTASSDSLFGGSTATQIAFALCAEGVDLVVRAEAGGGEASVQGCEGQQNLTGALAAMDVPRRGADAGDGWLVAFPVSEELPGPGLAPGAWLDLAWGAGAEVTAILAPRADGAAGAASGIFQARDFLRERIADGEVNRFLREASEAGTNVMDAGAVELLCPRDAVHASALLHDWMALLEAGYALAPLASSHSSWLRRDRPGAARTMVDAPSGSLEERLEALASGRTVASTGPVIDAVLHDATGSASPGETLAVVSGAPLELELHLMAADWVPVDRVRVLMGGREVWAQTLEGDGTLDEHLTVPLLHGGEGWLVVDLGRLDVQPQGDFASIYPGMPAYAVTAPIYLDSSAP